MKAVSSSTQMFDALSVQVLPMSDSDDLTSIDVGPKPELFLPLCRFNRKFYGMYLEALEQDNDLYTFGHYCSLFDVASTSVTTFKAQFDFDILPPGTQITGTGFKCEWVSWRTVRLHSPYPFLVKKIAQRDYNQLRKQSDGGNDTLEKDLADMMDDASASDSDNSFCLDLDDDDGMFDTETVSVCTQSISGFAKIADQTEVENPFMTSSDVVSTVLLQQSGTNQNASSSSSSSSRGPVSNPGGQTRMITVRTGKSTMFHENTFFHNSFTIAYREDRDEYRAICTLHAIRNGKRRCRYVFNDVF